MAEKNQLSLRQLLQASARSRNFPALERADAWAERLSLHLRDLQVLLEAPVAADSLPLPPRAKLEVMPAAARVPANDVSADLCFAGVAEIATRVSQGSLSPVEVAQAFLDRIQAHSELNAFASVQPDLVLREARALAERIAHGEDPGPLAGVPVAVKDLMLVKGYPYTCGSWALKGEIAQRDAEVVSRLRAAGALIIGTANLHELAYGVTSANDRFGHVGNPAVPGHIPGGSSGGSGAAVAAGLATIAVGTDTGGSIRIPAACCGVVGFKPTHDAVSREGVHALARTLDHIGPLTRSVADAAAAFEAMAGLPSGCIGAKRLEQPRFIRPVPYFYDSLDASVQACLERALEALSAAGASLTQREVAGTGHALTVQWVTLCTEACESNWQLLMEQAQRMQEETRIKLEIGQFIAAIDYVKAQRLRRQLRDDYIAALEGADVMLVPTLPISIPRSGAAMVALGARQVPVHMAMTRFTSPFNLMGLPVASIPCGKDGDGLPVSLQLVGRPGADATVLAAARWCEQVFARA